MNGSCKLSVASSISLQSWAVNSSSTSYRLRLSGKKNQVNQVAKSEHLIPFAKFHRGVKIQINQDRPRSIPCFGAYRCKHRCHNEVPFISAEHSTLQFSALKQALASAAPVLQQSSTKPLIRIRTSRELVRLKPTSQQKAQV